MTSPIHEIQSPFWKAFIDMVCKVELSNSTQYFHVRIQLQILIYFGNSILEVD